MSGKSRSGSEFPEVDFNFSADPHVLDGVALKDRRFIVVDALISLLWLWGISKDSPKYKNEVSDLSMERVVGSALSGIFYSGSRVHVLRQVPSLFGEKLETARALQPTDRATDPDLAAVRSAGETKHMEPPVLIDEGRARRRGLKRNDEGVMKTTNQSSPRAQIAAAVHSTLILLVLAHYAASPNSAKEKKLDPKNIATCDDFPHLDHKSMVYGIYYDETEVQFFAHFPQVVAQTIRNEPGRKYAIRFYQIQVAEFVFAGSTLLDRRYLAASLFYVQKHADILSERLAGKFTGSSQ
ncbi:hypothetical protein DFH06DRAFT_1328764 [Mycena polygramma]|nr:hypothetical protein DFH06DRAFT_1328764 [Mycena polygramma]